MDSVKIQKPTRKVLDFKPTSSEAMKPQELVRINGHQSLTLTARRAITILWHNAHMQGIEEGRDYTIEIAALRSNENRQLSNVREAIHSLMKTLLIVRTKDGRERAVQFLGGNDMDDPDRPQGTFTYSFDKRLISILQDSSIWSKIAVPILMTISSKYAVSLYENASQWMGLEHKLTQDFTLEEFRELLGVEKNKYKAFGDLNIHVLQPAVLEINALAPFNISVLPTKTGRRVTGVMVSWWRKSQDELKQAFDEVERPRVGRKARISQTVENLVHKPSQSPSVLLREHRKRMKKDPKLIEEG